MNSHTLLNTQQSNKNNANQQERNPNLLNVVSALILHPVDNRILLAKRKYRQVLGGYWELPSRPVKSGQSLSEALVEEVKESMGVYVVGASLIDTRIHAFKNRDVEVNTFVITDYHGEIDIEKPIEHARLDWFRNPAVIKPLAESFNSILPIVPKLLAPHLEAKAKERLAYLERISCTLN